LKQVEKTRLKTVNMEFKKRTAGWNLLGHRRN